MDELVRIDWLDGPWLAAMATITDPPEWLKRGTRVSFEYSPIGQAADFRGCEIRRRGYVTEVSVLSPGVKPAEPLAEVLTFTRQASPVPTSERTIASGLTGPEIEAQNKRSRSALDRIYDEWQASRSALERGGQVFYGGAIIRRPNIGTVTGIR